MKKNSEISIIDGVSYKQSNFLDLLDKKEEKIVPKVQENTSDTKKNTRQPLPRNQQAGFRRAYDEAMITLYIIGVLLNSREARLNPPQEIKREYKKSRKTQKRYERYMPDASQSIIHYGREIVDAYTCGNRSFLNEKEEEAYDEAKSLRKKLQKRGKKLTGLSPKQRMFRFTVNKIEQIISIMRQRNI